MAEKQLRNADLGGGGVPLISLLPGERARIVALGPGKGRQHHFRTMGLMEGKIVKLIATQPARGPFVIDVEGTQIALGRGMARQIFIEKL
ncbi:MAG: ferrous iron transport protein A [Methanomicrobia archaeon]|nr:ferrous iron transport protein A [Methanomicrobia archaeon]